MSTDGRFVFLVSGDDEATDRGVMTNLLSAVDVSTGEVVWQRGTEQLRAALQSPRSGSPERIPPMTYYLGPPLVDGDQLLLLAQRGEVIELTVLDRLTGETAWTIPLGTVTRTWRQIASD